MYGRLRPDYLSRCFGTNSPAKWMATNGFDSWLDIPDVPDCDSNAAGDFRLSMYELQDGRMSFPSSHTSLSFSIVGFTALWCYSKLCLFSNWGSWRVAIPLGLLMIPTSIAISRTSDYRHHSSDVVAASLLGVGMAFLSFRFYFPLKMVPLASSLYACHARHFPSTRLSITDAARMTSSDTKLGSESPSPCIPSIPPGRYYA
eukprot:Protomagalhaensia_sp_Gyna_25__3470@NODE_3121_length_722_cov_32_906296_g2608_i0_p1_GENE_NODE_3121_length_722_cov_32_906296_g2608_i0NODE_3121_length_722_cov_32_906296_g2608_i0_p1_ORF_typecomplete_len227_score16_80PAP2/PF01569_21/4_1e25PAP2_3/PF14378_6/0_022DUF202/PF02656_15/8_2_NODE_3121_length_722_cov_32_906296_g2608_i076681